MQRFVSPSAVLAALVALLSGCSFVYDFDRFYPGDASVSVDSGLDLAGEDGGPVDATVDATPLLDAGTDAGPSLSPDEFIEQFAALVCAKSLRCGDKLGLGVLLQELCHPAVGVRYFSVFVGTFGDARFDVAAAERCLRSLDSIDCSVSTDFSEDCLFELRGDAAVGAVCVSDVDCRSGTCEERADACGGECVATLPDGALCTSNSDCAPELRCRGGTCRTVALLSDVCEESQDCAPGFWCVGSGSRTCQVVPDEGQPCESSFGGDPCRGALVCTRVSGLAGQCRVGGAAGASCAFVTPCQPGLRCSVSDVCVPLVPGGGPCDSSQNCPPRHECIAEICTPYGVVGDVCSPTLPCAEGNCFAGRCALEPNGASCGGDRLFFRLDECAGFCDSAAVGGPICAARRPSGAVCDEDSACAAGLECIGAAGAHTCTSCGAP